MRDNLGCIMLVDDDIDDNFFHKLAIAENNKDLTVVVKDSGEKALAYIKSEEKPHTDLIFLDINMPIMNGWEFLEHYDRLDKALKSKVVIVMLSTSQNPADIAKAKSMDFVSDFITKPLTNLALEKIIEKYF